MFFEEVRDFCLSLPEAEEQFPFDNVTPVYKIRGKIFAIMSIDSPVSINIKGQPEKIIERIERFNSAKPGYHMNKVHWHTIELDGDVSLTELKEWIKESYNLIVEKLPKKQKNGLKLL